MRQARGLIPYAAVAALVVVASVVAVVAAIGGPQAVPAASAPAATPSPTAARTAARQVSTDLSAQGRLAYWRTEPTGEHLLFLANADNSRRRPVAKADRPDRVTKTKWSADGGSVAYVEGGSRLVVVRVDGATTSYALSAQLRSEGYRIVDHRFSPSGARIAATVQRITGGQSDVYLAEGTSWTRLTTVEDTLASDWLDESELLVQTTGGLVAALGTSGQNLFRPLTGMQASSPVIGADGRIHFLAGRVTGFAGTTETLVFAASANVWSMDADGADVRRELAPPDQESLRLDGTWPAGGYVYHRGTNPAQLVIGKIPILLPSSAGLIERIAASPDHRYAIGFTANSVVRVELTSAGLAPNVVLLLGSIDQGDVWFPRATPIVRGAEAVRTGVPEARYAFALGGNVWTTGPDGVASLLRPGALNAQSQRRFSLPVPVWSPNGDRLVMVESLGSGPSAFQLVPVIVDRAGKVTRVTTLPSVAPGVSWSPDGSALAAVALPASLQDPSVLQSELAIRRFDPAGAVSAVSVPGREVVWTAPGMLVLSNGTIRPTDRARDEQAIELWSGAEKRTVVTVARIVGDPRADAPGSPRGITSVSNLTAARDGSFAAFRVAFLSQAGQPSATPFIVLVRAADGAPTVFIHGDRLGDEAWSPTRALLGYTNTTGGTGLVGSVNEPKPLAVIHDAASGTVVAETAGRFAGWSPDGTWFYVARNDGLFARRLDGEQLLRVGPIGVPISATRP